MFWGPKNSLVLTYDYLTDAEIERFESQVQEVGKYYRFSFLSEVKRMGRAAVVLQNARKVTLLRLIPFLLSEGIPFTLGLDPDCLGLNRLPQKEENALCAESGVLDLNRVDPMRYFSTWGKIVELPPARWEPAYAPQSADVTQWTDGLSLIEFQLKRRPPGCLLPTPWQGNENQLRQLGFRVALGGRSGEVSKKTSEFDLPKWVF